MKPTAILKVVDRNGNVLEDHSTKPESKRVIDEDAVYKLNALLEEVISRGTGGNAAIGRPAAGKTGTTDDEHDAWFVGYTPDLVTAVWIGDDTNTNAGYTGGTVPAAIWRDFMSSALSGYRVKDFNVPESIRSQLAAAREAAAKKAAEDKKKAEEEKKKKEDSKSAGSKLLDKITGKTAADTGKDGK